MSRARDSSGRYGNFVLFFALAFGYIATAYATEAAIIGERAPKSLLLGGALAGPAIVGVGERGIVVRSDDHGQSWTQSRTPVNVTLTDVFFVDESNGWAVGADMTVLSTADGGITWTLRQNIDTLDGEKYLDVILMDIWFRDANVGLVVGTNGLFGRTWDGGSTWQFETLTNDAGLDAHLFDIEQADDRTFYIATEKSALYGGGGLYRSEDAGESWASIDVPYRGTLTGIVAIDSNRLIEFGLLGTIFVSDDKGDTWREAESQISDTLLAGTRLKNGDVILVGSVGAALLTNDAGRTFIPLPTPFKGDISDVVETSEGRVFGFGVGGVMELSVPNQVSSFQGDR